jgi:hypothetical protein
MIQVPFHTSFRAARHIARSWLRVTHNTFFHLDSGISLKTLVGVMTNVAPNFAIARVSFMIKFNRLLLGHTFSYYGNFWRILCFCCQTNPCVCNQHPYVYK